MAEAIADRLAEAFAEVLHGITRRELWAYAPDESLSPDDMLRVKYQGARLLRAAAKPGHMFQRCMAVRTYVSLWVLWYLTSWAHIAVHADLCGAVCWQPCSL